MSARREGLRQKKLPKPPKKIRSNAEHCAEYYSRLKQDTEAYTAFCAKKKISNRQYRSSRTEEQKARDRECACLRQQKRRKRKKEEDKKAAEEKLSSPALAISKPTKPTTRASIEKELETIKKNKEKAKNRQRKRRANMSAQKKRREAEKRRERYLRKKSSKALQDLENNMEQHLHKSPKRFAFFLKSSLHKLRHRRDRRSLVELQLLRGILKGETDNTPKHFYPRHKKDRKVEDFYISSSIDLPGKKTVRFADMTQKKVLTKRVQDLHAEFKEKYPLYTVSLTTFKRRRPDHVLLSSSRAFLQCLCEQCVNPMLKLDKLNPHLTTKVKNVEDLVNATLCADGYSRPCINRDCDNCGVERIIEEWKQEVHDKLQDEVTWLKWESTVHVGKDQVEKHGTMEEMIDDLGKGMKTLGLHYKTGQWQRRQYQDIISSLPEGHCVVTVDFAENYLCKFQNEVQSAHWSYRQVSVHPCVLQYNCEDASCSKIVTDYFVVLSDDLKHDAHFTKSVLHRVLEKVVDKGCKNVYIFSDGCSAQYKSKLPFIHLGELARAFPEIEIQRHFFGSHHGKSVCDSCGGVVKTSATKAVASGRAIIQSAEQMLAHCKQNMTLDRSDDCTHEKWKHIRRSFELVPPVTRGTSSDAYVTLKGTRSVHAIKPDNSEAGKLQMKTLSCFCAACTNLVPFKVTDSKDCPHANFTGQWEEGKVKEKLSRTRQKSTTQSASCPSQIPPPPLAPTSSLPPPLAPDSSLPPPLAPDSSLPPPLAPDSSLPPPLAPDSSLPPPLAPDSSLPPPLAPDRPLAPDSSLPPPLAPDRPLAPDSSLPPPLAPDSSPQHTDEEMFKNLQRQLGAAADFEQLQDLFAALGVCDILKENPIQVTSALLHTKHNKDEMAEDLYPSDMPKLCPLQVIGDGNCLPRSASLLAYGSQEHHVEMRIRIVAELLVHEEAYLDDDFLGKGHRKSNWTKRYAGLSDYYQEEELTTVALQRLLRREVFACLGHSFYMGVFQLHAIASILGCELQVIFPQYGGHTVRDDLNRMMHPREYTCEPPFLPTIMWSSTTGKRVPERAWKANHFVVCLPLDPASCTPAQAETTHEPGPSIIVEDSPATVTESSARDEPPQSPPPFQGPLQEQPPQSPLPFQGPLQEQPPQSPQPYQGPLQGQTLSSQPFQEPPQGELQCGRWVTVRFQTPKTLLYKYYKGTILEVSDQDILVKCLKKVGSHYIFPTLDDHPWVPRTDVTLSSEPMINNRQQYFF